MLPTACLIDPAPECAAPALLSALSALFSPLCRVAPVPPDGTSPAHDAARLTALSPSLPEAEARQLARIGALLSGPDAARAGEQIRQLTQALLSSGREAESSGAVLHELRVGRLPSASPAAPDQPAEPRLLRDLLLLLFTDQREREEAALDAELDRIGAAESRMFARLRDDENDENGDDEDDEPLLSETEETVASSALPRPEYTAAWLRVLARCALPCARPWFITRNAALAEALVARYQAGGFGQALALPEIVFSEDSTRAQTACPTCPSAAAEALARLQTAASEEEARLLVRDCARFLVDEAPRNAAAPGLARLNLHVLPNVAFAELAGLLAGLSNPADGATPRPDISDICLLGVCGPTGPVAAARIP